MRYLRRARRTPLPRHRRLLLLSAQLWWHPYWATTPSLPTARSELRRLVGARGVARAA
ncbi:hypothetical protein [Streptomyces albidoflavus]|uniref:hypothetical protein n=1 Tax=Streptomyces albidoflavus TaxID=1886 RepID=UPI003324F56E